MKAPRCWIPLRKTREPKLFQMACAERDSVLSGLGSICLRDSVRGAFPSLRMDSCSPKRP